MKLITLTLFLAIALTVFLAIALTMCPLAGYGPGCAGCLSLVRKRDKKLILSEEQRPDETERQTSTWPCWFGLTTCPVKKVDENKNQVLPEQHRADGSKSQTSSWLCWLGLTDCPVRNTSGNKDQVVPEEQRPVESKSPTLFPTISLTMPSFPGYVPGGATYLTWVRYSESKVVDPEGPKQTSLDPKPKAEISPGILAHLRNNLAQELVALLLVRALIHICILCLTRIAHGLWRRVRSLWGQGRRLMASASSGAQIPEEEDENVSEMLPLTEDLKKHTGEKRQVRSMQSTRSLRSRGKMAKGRGARKRSSAASSSSS